MSIFPTGGNGSTSDQVTVPDLLQRKTLAAGSQSKKITCLTAYDYPTARLIDEAGVDVVLVGDSLAMVMLGHDSTLPLTLDEALHHTKAVRRGVERALVVAEHHHRQRVTHQHHVYSGFVHKTPRRVVVGRQAGYFLVLGSCS